MVIVSQFQVVIRFWVLFAHPVKSAADGGISDNVISKRSIETSPGRPATKTVFSIAAQTGEIVKDGYIPR